jgi:hypothetical protein
LNCINFIQIVNQENLKQNVLKNQPNQTNCVKINHFFRPFSEKEEYTWKIFGKFFGSVRLWRKTVQVEAGADENEC